MQITDSEKILLLEQDLKNHKQQSDDALYKFELQIKELDGRVKTIELSKQKTDYQYEQIMDSLKVLNDTTIPNLTIQIEELKNKPIKRYDQAIASLIGAVFGALGGVIINVVF